MPKAPIVGVKRLVSLGLISLLFAGCTSPQPPQLTDQEEWEQELERAEPLNISIPELERQTEKNRSDASIKYLGKKVNISGKLQYVSAPDTTSGEFPTVSISVGDTRFDATFCANVPTDHVRGLTVGESQIEVVGIIGDLNELTLSNCRIIQSQSN